MPGIWDPALPWKDARAALYVCQSTAHRVDRQMSRAVTALLLVSFILLGQAYGREGRDVNEWGIVIKVLNQD